MKSSLTLGNIPFRSALCGALLFGLAACEEDTMNAPGFKDDGLTAGDARLVYNVTSIEVAVLESLPLQIHITAAGHTRTGGWSDVRLELDEEASEGIRLVYRFVAVPPSGMATQAITPVQGSATYGPWVDRAARQIEVIAETNTEILMFPSADQE